MSYNDKGLKTRVKRVATAAHDTAAPVPHGRARRPGTTPEQGRDDSGSRAVHNLVTETVGSWFAIAIDRRRAGMVAICLASIACRTDSRQSISDSASGQLGDSTATVAASALLGDSTATIGSMMERVDGARAAGIPVSDKPNVDQQHVLDALVSLGGKPIEALSVTEARKQPSPADAVMAVLKHVGKPVTPEAVGAVSNRTIPTSAGSLPIRVYTPEGRGPFPVIVYYHGGGFVIATIDTYDGSARALANAAGAVLVSVEYRKAPEHKFPAAHSDALAAYEWVLANTAKLQGDPSRVALAGESAGGNLAVATAVAARDKHLQLPTSILAVYPIAGTDTNTASYREQADSKPLNRAMMAWFLGKYMRTAADGRDPRLNLLNADLQGLPPVTIINASIDPLRTDGELLAARLRDAGVTVEQKQFDGVAHEFFGQGAVLPEARDAVKFGARSLKTGFEK